MVADAAVPHWRLRECTVSRYDKLRRMNVRWCRDKHQKEDDAYGKASQAVGGAKPKQQQGNSDEQQKSGSASSQQQCPRV